MDEIIEKGLIGSLLFKDNLENCLEWLDKDAFTYPLNRLFYTHLQRYYKENGQRPDVAQLVEMVKDESLSESDILIYIDDAIRVAKPDYYSIKTAETLMHLFWKKQIYTEIVKSDGVNIPEVLDRVQKIINNASIDIPQGEDAGQMAENYVDDYFHEKNVECIKTGFYSIDSIVTFEGGDIGVIGARPSVGKSALATQIATNMAMQGKRVLYFNLEMKTRQVYERIIARLADINISRLRKATSFRGNDSDKYFKAVEKLKSIGDKLIVISGRQSASSIKKIAKGKHPDIVIVDYLQMAKVNVVYKQRYVDVAELSHEFKELALDMDIPIILLSQLNRLSGAGKEPTMAELRESGDIEQDASIIILL